MNIKELNHKLECKFANWMAGDYDNYLDYVEDAIELVFEYIEATGKCGVCGQKIDTPNIFAHDGIYEYLCNRCLAHRVHGFIQKRAPEREGDDDAEETA